MNWDDWRRNYDSMTFAAHQEFNQQVALAHPEQRHWDADACRRFLTERNPLSVLELGGWDGSLAAEMLPQSPGIRYWRNFDITEVAQVCTDPRYTRAVLTDWPWLQHRSADVLVASHVFEHMRIDEIEALLAKWHVESIFVDCPIAPGAQSWDSYPGTHILEVGSDELVVRIKRLGFDLTFTDSGSIFHFDR